MLDINVSFLNISSKFV